MTLCTWVNSSGTERKYTVVGRDEDLDRHMETMIAAGWHLVCRAAVGEDFELPEGTE